MTKTLKILSFAIGGIVGLVALVALALIFFVDANSYKPQLQTAASEALGLDVQIGGRLRFGFSPGLHVSLDEIHLRNRSADIVSATRARIGIDLIPLLQKQIRIGKIRLNQPILSIERNRDGIFNFEQSEKTEKSDKKITAFSLANVFLSDATLRYTDEQSGTKFEGGNCDLTVRHLRVAGGSSADLMKQISLAAELSCKSIQIQDVTVSDLSITVNGKQGVYHVNPISMKIFGATGLGNMQADFSGVLPTCRLQFSLPQFRVEEFFKILTPQKIADGPMDFSIDFSTTGKTIRELKQAADGTFSLQGEYLVFHGGDLDKKLASFESSQNFSLVDAGAFFFVGPLGVAASKGYDFAGIFQGSDGSSEIRRIVSDWKVDHGIARTKDVAMATKQYRIALAGELDFVNEQFNEMNVALLDTKGCATVRQKISGPFQKPVVEKPSMLKTLAGPALKLLKKGRDLLPGGKCEVFYNGAVAAPKK